MKDKSCKDESCKHAPLPYARASITQTERDAVLAVLAEPNSVATTTATATATVTLTQGERLLAFERSVAQSVRASHAVACANATAALHLALLAAEVRHNDRVLTQSISFCATANAVRHCNAVPVFADIDAETLGLSPHSAREAAEQLQKAGRPIKAILPVLMGGGADARNAAELLQLKQDLNCLLIEDAAHALGGYYDPEQQQPIGCGDYADISVFSFHPIKPITSAEGGVAVTNNADLAERMRRLRNHGIERNPEKFEQQPLSDTQGNTHYEMIELGFNYRLSELHAALGVAQMKRLQPLREKRRALAEHYDTLFANSPLSDCLRPLQRNNRRHSAHHLYIVSLDWQELGMPRRSCMQALQRQGIQTQVHYIPIHHHPYYQQRDKDDNLVNCEKPVELANSEHYAKSTLSLPLFADMRKSDVERVVATLEGLRQCASI